MLSLKTRLLARIDLLVGWDFVEGDAVSGCSMSFYNKRGGTMRIIGTDGRVRITCGSKAVEHLYNHKGKLISRTVLREAVREGETVKFSPETYSSKHWPFHSFVR